MKKIVCESLYEYDESNLLLEADDDHGPIQGMWRAIKSAPGRALRRSRARSIMEKYRIKIIEKLDIIVNKYQKNLENLVYRTQESIDNINKSKSVSIQALQKEDILNDMVDSYKGILTQLKDSMLEQLKIHAESINQRLERPGTITGSKFLPEDKIELLSEWKLVESGINQEIQNRLITLLDDPFVSKFTEIKAELKDFVEEKLKYGYVSSVKDEDSNESSLYNSDELHLYNDIINKGDIELDTPYQIINPGRWNQHSPNTMAKINGEYVSIKIDNKKGKLGYIFYKVDKKKAKKIRSTQNIIYLIEPGESYAEGKTRLGIILTSIGK